MINASPFQAGDKVVAYCRYSGGDEQGLKNTSADEQEAAIRQFCVENGLNLVRVYADPFVSGRSTKGRDHYLEMLSDLLHKKQKDTGIKGLVLWDWERYGRSFDQAQLDAARLRMAGYKLYSLQQPIADSGPFSHVLEAMYFASAQNQSDMISADVKRALQNNYLKYKVIPRSCIGWGWIAEPVDMGFFSDGTRRSGFRSVPDPEKIQGIRDAIDARLRGASITQCRQIMGAPNNLDVKRLFKKIQLYGAFSYGGTTIEDYCDPIISREKYDILQAFEAAHVWRQIGRQGGWSADPPMLSGLLYCGYCGDPMYINRRKSKGHLYCTYRCKNCCTPGLRQEVLEPIVIDQCGQILSAENIRMYVDQLSVADSSEVAENSRRSIEKDLAAIEKKIDNAVSLLLDHPSDALSRKLSELEARQAELRDRLQSLGRADVSGFDADVLFKTTLEISNRIMSVLCNPDATPSDKRTALSIFVRSIVVDRESLVINFLPPGFPQKVVTGPDSAPPSNIEKTGGVVSEPAHNPKAPPEGPYSRSQRFDVLRSGFHGNQR